MTTTRTEALAAETLAALAESLAPIEPAPERKATLRADILAKAKSSAAQSITVHSGEGEWQTIATGVQMKVLHDHGDAQSFLVRMHPGSSLPAHHHHREELCVVLEGEVMLGDIAAHAGTYHLALSGSDHSTIRSANGCLLFIRAPLDANLSF